MTNSEIPKAGCHAPHDILTLARSYMEFSLMNLSQQNRSTIKEFQRRLSSLVELKTISE